MTVIKRVAVLLLAVSHLTAADLGPLPTCGVTCMDNLQGQFASLGCASSSDTACLCANAAFKEGINDCAVQHCVPPEGSTDDAALVKTYADNFCSDALAGTTAAPIPSTTAAAAAQTTTEAPQEPAATTSEAAPPPATTSEAAPVTSEQPSTTSAAPSPTVPVTSEAPAVETTSTPPPVAPSTTLLTAPPTTSSAAASPDATESSTSTEASSTPSPSESAAATGTADAKSPPEKSKSPSGLSIGAIAGISAGGAALVLASLVILLLKCRRAKQKPSYDYMNPITISEPLPGAGRYYGQDLGAPQQPPSPYSPSIATASMKDPLSSQTSELDLRSRRYEDMVPRMAPKLIR
ncbi:hypothetical protein DL546_008780 [Coniochaeta pulveracea]|uniref:CFEM domain-containing protein n=1 Tax=Coniochaeta pulveracea TaxID=177199 RepID=A0A420YFY0_9PEZI|nr:hypothetical protein DL546_008780 [Coniochaeta pulveracea]